MWMTKQFYTGAWGLFPHSKNKRGGKCERCGFTVVEKERLGKANRTSQDRINRANISDPNISLNPDNVEEMQRRVSND